MRLSSQSSAKLEEINHLCKWMRLLQMEYGFKKKRFIIVYRLEEDDAFQRESDGMRAGIFWMLAYKEIHGLIASWANAPSSSRGGSWFLSELKHWGLLASLN